MFAEFVTEAFDGSQDLVCGLGPFEGPRVFVVEVDEGADVCLELPDGGVNASLYLLSGGSANQGSTWLIHDAEVGVKWT